MKDPAWHPVISALRELHEAAGRPSYRTVALRAKCSHTTVHNALTGGGESGLTWQSVRRVTSALGGDPELIRPLYDLARKTVLAARPDDRRTQRSVWRQDVVSAAWVAVNAHRSGLARETAEAMGRLQELFAIKP